MFGTLLFVSENDEKNKKTIKMFHNCMGSLEDERMSKLYIYKKRKLYMYKKCVLILDFCIYILDWV